MSSMCSTRPANVGEHPLKTVAAKSCEPGLALLGDCLASFRLDGQVLIVPSVTVRRRVGRCRGVLDELKGYTSTNEPTFISFNAVDGDKLFGLVRACVAGDTRKVPVAVVVQRLRRIASPVSTRWSRPSWTRVQWLFSQSSPDWPALTLVHVEDVLGIEDVFQDACTSPGGCIGVYAPSLLGFPGTSPRMWSQSFVVSPFSCRCASGGLP